MCNVLYIGASKPIPHIPWSENKPGFHVTGLNRDLDREVRIQFSLPFIFYAGSHELCGCGFSFSEDPGNIGLVLSPQVKRSHENLALYLKDALSQGIAIQLFACKEGDQQKSPKNFDSVTTSQLAEEKFCFKEKQFLEVVGDYYSP